MQAEGRRQDYKLTFGSTNPAALLELVKDSLAFANSDGGEIVAEGTPGEVCQIPTPYTGPFPKPHWKPIR